MFDNIKSEGTWYEVRGGRREWKNLRKLGLLLLTL